MGYLQNKLHSYMHVCVLFGVFASEVDQSAFSSSKQFWHLSKVIKHDLVLRFPKHGVKSVVHCN